MRENYTMLAELRALRHRLEECERALVGIRPMVEWPPLGSLRLKDADRYMSKWRLEVHDDEECPCCDGTGWAK